ncbi:tetratricopeptide repeat protein [uncultured Sphaerotilus sp.]|uniref:tetratricopeptide repeat protein n=1 Tax=uncultured Sphaerotilus sp. TaxID=474984 RepID=UPI0030CA4852
MAGRSKETVYVSSTFVDLERHRAALKTALERAQYDVECMEKYPAFDERPVDKCLADVAACDVYVLLVAHRYGYVPAENNPHGRSITELEHDEAVRLNKPRLVFCVDEDEPWPPKMTDKTEPALGRLNAFRQRVNTDRGIRTFSSPADLASLVLQALAARNRPAAPPPAPDARRIPFELPPAANNYFGRPAQRADLLDRLRRGQSAAVVGAAGMGKTAVAAVVLADLLGLRGERLADSPFPDGVVFLDLYALQAQPEMVWDRLASRLHGEAFLQRAKSEQRAAEACRRQRVLVVIEGAEVADGQTPRADLPTLLSVLSPENRTLVLTRSSAQVLPAQTVSLAQALAPEDAADLLDELTRDTLAPDLRQRVLRLLQGHPLALHWAGNLLARDDDDPALLIGDWERGALPSLSDPVNAGHTLRWLFDHSARSLDDPARQALGLCARLGAAPVPLALVEAGMGDSAREALKRLVQQGLMRREASLSAHWAFCHVLAHGYAREAIAAPEEGAQQRLADWLHGALPAAVGSSARPCAVDEAQVGRLLVHAQAVLLADPQGSLVRTVSKVLLYDVPNRLEELGHSTLTHRALTSVDAWFAQLLPAVAQRTSMQRERGAILSRLGNVLGLQGDLAGALQAYRDGLAVSERLARADAMNLDWQHDLSVSHSNVGDVLQVQGDLAGALHAYQDALTISERLARTDATNAGWQRDLSVSHEKVGNVLRAQGDLTGALQVYRDCLEISERLARADATNADWQRDLCVSYNKVGNVLQAQGDLAGALQAYRNGLEISERLAQVDATNTGWQLDFSVCHERVGEVLQAQGDLTGALQAYQHGLTISERLARADATNADWQYHLSGSHTMIGYVLQAQGDWTGALQACWADLDISERLARSDAMNAKWQHGLCVSHEKLGDVYVAQGSLIEALAWYQKSLTGIKRLAEADPRNAGWRCDVMGSLTRVAGVHKRLNDHVQALRCAEEALAIGQRLVALDATNQTWRIDTEVARVLVQRLQTKKGSA